MKMADGDKPCAEAPKRLPGTIRLRGISWPWMVTQESLEGLNNYDIWDDDVWVTTYPKAGTHWITEMVNLILVDGHEDHIHRVQDGPPAEFDCTPASMEFSMRRPATPLPQYKMMLSWKPPRVVKSHLLEDSMPTQIYQGKGKVIYVIRNPKDIAVSMWHFLIPFKLDERFEKWDSFFDQYLMGECPYGSWFDHVLNFWNKHRYDKNFLFLTFEEIKRETRGAIIEIADFLETPLSEDAIDRVMKFSSIESMKTRFESAGPENKHLVYDGRIAGDWKTQFTVAQNEAFDQVFQEKMAGSGLKIQFE